jgi:hypothetical protein
MCWAIDDLRANRIEFTKEMCKINESYLRSFPIVVFSADWLLAYM